MSSFQIYEPDVDFDDEQEAPKPKPRHNQTFANKPPEALYAEMMMWQARARQNRAETRAVEAEGINKTKKLRSEAHELRKRLRAAEERITELEGDQQ